MEPLSELPSIYQLRIVLRGISPLIWRRLLVYSDTTLAQLHDILQLVFDWSDEHLHEFHIHGKDYGSNSASTRFVQLNDFRLRPGERFRYVYDFGAYWQCDVRLESTLPIDANRFYPVCIGGKGAVPPEHCRDAWTYMEMLDEHRYPPINAMLVAAEAVRTLLDADSQSSILEALGDMDELREAVDCLRDYQQFQPDKLNRRDINAQLRVHAQRVGGKP